MKDVLQRQLTAVRTSQRAYELLDAFRREYPTVMHTEITISVAKLFDILKDANVYRAQAAKYAERKRQADPDAMIRWRMVNFSESRPEALKAIARDRARQHLLD